jgi:ABC-type transport system involved in cytochrome c biogenesis permease subunit
MSCNNTVTESLTEPVLLYSSSPLACSAASVVACCSSVSCVAPVWVWFDSVVAVVVSSLVVVVWLPSWAYDGTLLKISATTVRVKI